jgi:tetratricopeptide (TPR) repeat protein
MPAPPDAAPTPPELSAADRRQLEAGRGAMAAARSVDEIEPALAAVRDVADRNPASAEAQLLAAEIAYRARRFEEAVRYFDRGGEPPAGRPDLLFYRAVALYESGRRADAAEVLERALPSLRRTPFVEDYVSKILGPRPE